MITSPYKMKMRNIKTRVFLRFGFAPLVLGLIFFLPAGSFRFWEAWVYMSLLILQMFLVVLYFLKKNPALLERRMRTREKEREQNVLHAFFGLFMLAGFLLPGFDFRWQWSHIPVCLILAADAIVLFSYVIFFFVMKKNSYLSRTVEVDEGQMRIIAFLTDYAVVDRIIHHLKLTFVAERPPPPQVAFQELLMAEEAGSEYFS